jgi:hypothetical protein
VTDPDENKTGVAERAGGAPRHAAPEGAERDPLIDMTRDPTPGVADHAAHGDDDGDQPG